MNKNIKNLLKNYYFVSFMLGALCYYMFLSYSQLAGGKYVILEGDSLSGFASPMRAFCDNLMNGKGLAYSWSIGLGCNGFLLLPQISISLPIYLLLYKLDISIVVIICLSLKAGLASMFFYLYMEKIWKQKGAKVLIFAVFYSMCAYQVAFMPFLITYEDAIFMLPLILYVCSEYANKGSFKLLIFSYLYLFVSFFYTAYIVGFFSLFYLILYLIFINRYTLKTIIKKLFLFGVYIFITAGISMLVLFPQAYYFLTSYAEDATTISSVLNVNIFDFYNQLFIGQNSKILNVCPYIYCGLPTIVLIPFYFANKKIGINEKVVNALLSIFMIISGFVTPIYLFWHCFDAPDNFFYRYSFIISFMFCIIACREADYISEIRNKLIFIVVILNILFYSGYMYIIPLLNRDVDGLDLNNIPFLLINASFLFVYLGWFIAFKKKKEDKKIYRALLLLIVFITSTESVVNGFSTYYKSEWLSPTNYYDTYKLWNISVSNVLDTIKEDGGDGFYRITCENDYEENGSLYFNYNGVSYFSNVENYKLRKCLEALGLTTSIRIVQPYGLSDFTDMILGIKYNIISIDYGAHKDYVLDFNQQATLEKNPYCLSLGFLVDDDILDFAFAGRNCFVNINDLASSMTGEKISLFDCYSGEVSYEGYGIQLISTEDNRAVLKLEKNANSDYNVGTFFWSIPLDDRRAYVQLEYGESAVDRFAPYVIDGDKNQLHTFERLGATFIKEMIRFDKEYAVGICMGEDTYDVVFYPYNTYFAYYNSDEFLKAYDELRDGQLDIYDYGNGWVKGHIDVAEDNKILFTSIPYDEGWEIKVNGEKTEPLRLLDGAFIGISLPKGNYDIEFKYHVPGFKTGLLISLISIGILIILFIINPILSVKERPKKDKKDNEMNGNTCGVFTDSEPGEESVSEQNVISNDLDNDN